MRRDITLPSGRFLLRIEPRLHASLQASARAAGLSLNEYCRRSLASPGSSPGAGRPASDVVERAASLFAGALVGVLLYGSHARGEAETTSDVDVLIVVDRSVNITRGLYRRWDESPVSFEGRPVDPHFAHLPEATERASGLWAELALDGIVIFERGLELSRALVRIRREVAAHGLLRRVVHGQPYWTTRA